MKTKSILLFTVLLGSLLAVSFVFANNSISDKLSGRILLQVEEKGEAWYVDPHSKERSFLGRPTDAFDVMREKGIGATNNDLNKIPISLDNLSGLDSDGDGLPDNFEIAIGTNPNNSDSDGDGHDDYTELLNGYNPLGINKLSHNNNFSKAQAGRILLQVEGLGEAWYINPEDNKRYFLGRPDDAFNLMRELGLGITNVDLEKINRHQFSQQQNQNNNSKPDISTEGNEGSLDFEDLDLNINQEREIILQDFQENFAPKILNCEVGEVYQLNVRGAKAPVVSHIKIDNTSHLSILSGDANNCQIKQEVTDIFYYIADDDLEAQEELYDFLDFLVDDLAKDSDELSVVFQMPLQNLSVENRILLEDLDLGVDFDYNSTLTVEQFLLQAMTAHLEEEVSQLNESVDDLPAAVSFCSGPSDALVNFFGNTITRTNEISMKCSYRNSDMVCEYPNNITCTQTIDQGMSEPIEITEVEDIF